MSLRGKFTCRGNLYENLDPETSSEPTLNFKSGTGMTKNSIYNKRVTHMIKFSTTRTVTITMMYVLVLLLGLLGWYRLPREFMPNIEFPQLMIITNYENASSQEVENLVTKVVEEAAGTVKGVKRIHSVSKEGVSIVTIEFLWNTNMDFASLNLREKIDVAKVKLPRDADEPQIEKFNPFALPVMIISLTGQRSPQELLKIAQKPVVELLQKVPKVATVSVVGGLEREIKIELDQSKLASYNVPLLKVVESIDRNNITYPAGSVEDKTFEYVIRVMGAFKKPQDIEKVVVQVDRNSKLPSNPTQSNPNLKNKTNPNEKSIMEMQPIELGYLGTVVDSFKDRTSYSRYDRKENVSLSVLKQGDANVVEVAKLVKEKLPDIREKLPKGVHLNVVYDQSTFIQKGIRDLVKEGVMGAILCLFILYLFLGNYKEALVVNTVIPTSILITVFLMYASGMSLNTISLAGLVVGIGFLTDGAIVIIENITRYKEQGKSFKESAVLGTEGVFGAVTGSMATMTVVFLPLVFVVGTIGKIFKDLSLTIVFTHLASWIVYFTLLPMLASFISVSKEHKKSFIVVRFNQLWDKSVIFYDKILNWAFKHPKQLFVYVITLFLGSLAIIIFLLPREVFPKIDGNQFTIQLQMPIKTKLDITNKISEKIENFLKTIPVISHVSTTIGSSAKESVQTMGSHEAKIVIDLEEKRKETCDEIMQKVKKHIEKFDLLGGHITFVADNQGSFGGIAGNSSPIVIEIKGYDFDDLSHASDTTQKKLKKITGIFNVTTSLSLNSQELGVEINRDNLSRFGLSVNDVSNTILPAVKGKIVSKFREEGKEIDIRVILDEKDRNNLNAVGRLLIHSPLNLDVPLDSFAHVYRQLGPNEILHYDQQRTVLVSASLFNRSLNDVRPNIEGIIQNMRIKNPNLSFQLTGAAAEMDESFKSLKIIVLLSIMLVYMIMAAQFESFWQPFLIMLTIPLSMIGMGPALFLTGNSLSAMAGIGMVLLCGIVVSNGIVLIDFVNDERKNGATLKDALIKACHIRIRPIMMTVFTTALALSPVAIGFSKESQMQSPMAIVILSGFIVSTFLTLVVIPVFYYYVDFKIFNNHLGGSRRR